MSKAFFVTGTDTEVGKTAVSCALLEAGRAAGLRTAAVKPVATSMNSVKGVAIRPSQAMKAVTPSGLETFLLARSAVNTEAMSPASVTRSSMSKAVQIGGRSKT